MTCFLYHGQPQLIAAYVRACMVKLWLYHCQTMVDHGWKSQLRTQASSRYPNYQRRLGTERDSEFFSANFPDKLAR